jgi:mannose-1-phosphate guanylyltransferase
VKAPECAYGWIEPGAPLAESSGNFISDVSRFWEKPSRRIAMQLMRRGCLWNSFVMVGAVGAFIKTIRHTLPNLLACFESMWATMTPGMEYEALRDLYLKVPATNFSDQVLSARPSDLAVIPPAVSAGAISVSPSGFFRCSGSRARPRTGRG